MKASEKRKAKVRQDEFADFLEQEEKEAKDDNKIEIVPALRYDDYDVDSLAEMRVLARKMLRKKDREEIMENTYSRFARPVDEDAPQWFLDDENKHNHKILPITKEEFKAEKERLLAIKNRPIKKVSDFFKKGIY
jgi:AdoMet-dependent rRNA methyltransferase SPB1